MNPPKKPNRRQIERVLDFVVHELIRYDEISKDPKNLMDAVKQDGWIYDLPLPNNRTKLIGKAANRRLYELCKRIVSSDERLHGKVTAEKYKEILSRRFGEALSEKKEIEELAFVEDCTNEVTSTLFNVQDIYIPCIAPGIPSLKKFVIGPVTFYQKETFLKERAEDIQHYDSLAFHEFETCYKVQNWIALVRISGFEDKLATERAYLCVRLALASIKCYVDLSQSRWSGTEKQSMPTLRGFSLRSFPDSSDPKAIHYGWSQKYIDRGSKEVVTWLMSSKATRWFRLFGLFLESVKETGQHSFIQSKIVTAMVWLDIGNSQISDAEKVVAFSNCLEALFVSSDQGIKRQIVERSRGLLDHSGWKPETHERVAEFYSCRCALVHGETSPLDAEVIEAAQLGKYLTDVCVEGFLYFAHWMLSKHQDLGTRDEELPYLGKGGFEKAMTVELPLFIKIINTGRRQGVAPAS